MRMSQCRNAAGSSGRPAASARRRSPRRGRPGWFPGLRSAGGFGHRWPLVGAGPGGMVGSAHGQMDRQNSHRHRRAASGSARRSSARCSTTAGRSSPTSITTAMRCRTARSRRRRPGEPIAPSGSSPRWRASRRCGCWSTMPRAFAFDGFGRFERRRVRCAYGGQCSRADAADRRAGRRHGTEEALVVNLLDAKLAAPNPDFLSYTLSK